MSGTQSHCFKTQSYNTAILVLWTFYHKFRLCNWNQKCILYTCKGKVKCTLVQALRLCTDRRAHKGSRGIALPFHDHGTKRKLGVNVTPRLLFTPGKDPVCIVQEAGCAPGSVWTEAENLAPIGIRSPGRPACSHSLYRLLYPAHLYRHKETETCGGPLAWCIRVH